MTKCTINTFMILSVLVKNGWLNNGKSQKDLQNSWGINS